MPYVLHISNKARKFVEKSFPDYKKILKVQLEELASNPYPRGSIPLEGKPNCYRIRVGPFRIQYAVLVELNEILVFKISRRSETTYR